MQSGPRLAVLPVALSPVCRSYISLLFSTGAPLLWKLLICLEQLFSNFPQTASILQSLCAQPKTLTLITAAAAAAEWAWRAHYVSQWTPVVEYYGPVIVSI